MNINKKGKYYSLKDLLGMNSNEKSIYAALSNGKLVKLKLKSGCVLNNVSGSGFAIALLNTLDPDHHFNVCNAVAFYACSLMKDCMSENGLNPGDFPKDDFAMFGALFAEYTAGMTSAMNHASSVNWYHYTRLFCDSVYDLCNQYLENGYCTYHKI